MVAHDAAQHAVEAGAAEPAFEQCSARTSRRRRRRGGSRRRRARSNASHRRGQPRPPARRRAAAGAAGEAHARVGREALVEPRLGVLVVADDAVPPLVRDLMPDDERLRRRQHQLGVLHADAGAARDRARDPRRGPARRGRRGRTSGCRSASPRPPGRARGARRRADSRRRQWRSVTPPTRRSVARSGPATIAKSRATAVVTPASVRSGHRRADTGGQPQSHVPRRREAEEALAAERVGRKAPAARVGDREQRQRVAEERRAGEAAEAIRPRGAP